MNCQHCEDRGWTVLADGGAGSASRCLECLPALDDRMTRAGVWERYQDASRESWEAWSGAPIRWPSDLISCWDHSVPLLTLYGPTGAGKTSLGTAIFRERLYAGARGRWVHMPTWLAEQKASFSRPEEDVRGVTDLANTAGILLVDEAFSRTAERVDEQGRVVHTPTPTPWELDVLFLVVSYRAGRGLLTILTSMVRLSEAVLAVGPIGSRLAEGIAIEVEGPDQRIEAALLRAAGGR